MLNLNSTVTNALVSAASTQVAGPRSTAELMSRIMDPYGVYCVLELKMGKDSIYHLFPVMPESLSVAQRYLQTITPTQGGVFVDDYGRAPSPVLLSGTFGRSPRLDIAFGQEALLKQQDRIASAEVVNNLRSVAQAYNPLTSVTVNTGDVVYEERSGAPVTGYKLVKLLSEMVDLSHVPDSNGNLPTAVFYNFAFGQSYEVALTGFQAQMDVTRNTLWYYQLEMVMLKRLDTTGQLDLSQVLQGANPARVFAASQTQAFARLEEIRRATSSTAAQVTSRTTRQSLLSPRNTLRLQTALDTVQRGRETISRINGKVSTFRGLDALDYGSAILDRTLGLSPGTVLRFYDTLATLPLTLGDMQSIVSQTTRRIPRETVDALRIARDGVQQIFPAIEQLVDSVNLGQLTSINFSESTATAVLYAPEMEQVMALAESVLLVTEQLDAADVLLQVYGFESAATSSYSSVFSSSPPDSAGPSSSSYVIRQGDTLFGIAQRAYGDESGWTLIAGLLPPAYADIAPTQLLNNLVGTVISIPSLDFGTAALVPYVWDSPNGVRSFGRDLPDTLTTVTRPDGTVDLAVLTEEETLLQGLVHRLQTPAGTIPEDATFGSNIPAMIGQDFGSLSGPMNEAKIAESLRQDPRLTSVSNVMARQGRGDLQIGFSAVARNAGSLGTIDLTIERQTP